MTPTILRKGDHLKDPAVGWVQSQLRANGYDVEITNEYDAPTISQVVVFQYQHIGKDGKQLKADGEIAVGGSATWWALEHPSGNAQRNYLPQHIPSGLTPLRQQFLAMLFAEYSQPVYEIPDGSNRSPIIDGYWGNTGLLGYAWCCASASTMYHRLLGEYRVGGIHHVGVQKYWHAAEKLGFGTGAPKPGDSFIQIHASGQGHRGIVIGVSQDAQTIYTWEGNAGNREKLGKRESHTIDYFVDEIRDGQSLNFERRDSDIASTTGDSDR